MIFILNNILNKLLKYNNRRQNSKTLILKKQNKYRNNKVRNYNTSNYKLGSRNNLLNPSYKKSKNSRNYRNNKFNNKSYKERKNYEGQKNYYFIENYYYIYKDKRLEG